MNIQEYISKDCVTFQLQADKKEAALKEMAELLYQAGKVKNLSLYLKAVEERELEYTTGIVGGIAILLYPMPVLPLARVKRVLPGIHLMKSLSIVYSCSLYRNMKMKRIWICSVHWRVSSCIRKFKRHCYRQMI